MTRIAILGSGMAGLGAAHRLRQQQAEALVYEKEGRPGGHTRSYQSDDGFIFDDGPHISFTRDERLQKLLAESVGGKYEVLQAYVNNHWQGNWIKHPAQCNLSAVPPALAARILEEFVEVQQADPEAVVPANYEEWLVASYGRTFAETFPMQYGHKYHTATAAQMTTDWLGPRLYRPDLAEVIEGAIAEETRDVHYVDHFRYPSYGGFEAYLRMFLEEAEVRVGMEVVRIEPGSGVLGFANGESIAVEGLVSSIPLPRLVSLICGAPGDVAEAASRLACTQCVTVNLGIRREGLSPAHWTYIYDDDFTTTRLSFPHLFSPHTVPPGCSSVQAEVYFSEKYRPLTTSPEALVDPVIEDLRRLALIQDDDEIVHRSARLTPYANVIFDHDRAAALETVHGYLEEVGIGVCGRYGEWGYQWTDEAFVSGESAAQRVLDGFRFGR